FRTNFLLQACCCYNVIPCSLNKCLDIGCSIATDLMSYILCCINLGSIEYELYWIRCYISFYIFAIFAMIYVPSGTRLKKPEKMPPRLIKRGQTVSE
ncbi:hypothetical protein ACJX0J_016384, partial [Zea mays]